MHVDSGVGAVGSVRRGPRFRRSWKAPDGPADTPIVFCFGAGPTDMPGCDPSSPAGPPRAGR